MLEVIKRITTIDGTVYQNNNLDSTKLWQIELKLNPLDKDFRVQNSLTSTGWRHTFYTDEKTLQRHGLVPKFVKGVTDVTVIDKKLEDLVLELLERVGVYPSLSGE